MARPKLTEAEAEANRARILSGRFKSRFRGQGDTSPPSADSQARLDRKRTDGRTEARLAPQSRLDYQSEQNPKGQERPNSGNGHARIYHDYFDAKIEPLSGYAQLLWVWLNRHRDHGSEITIVLNWPMLARKTGFSARQLSRAAAEMEEAGIVERFGYVTGRGKTQGFRFRLAPQTSLASQSRLDRQARLAPQSDSKRIDLKDKDIKEIHTPTAEEIETYERATGRKWGSDK